MQARKRQKNDVLLFVCGSSGCDVPLTAPIASEESGKHMQTQIKTHMSRQNNSCHINLVAGLLNTSKCHSGQVNISAPFRKPHPLTDEDVLSCKAGLTAEITDQNQKKSTQNKNSSGVMSTRGTDLDDYTIHTKNQTKRKKEKKRKPSLPVAQAQSRHQWLVGGGRGWLLWLMWTASPTARVLGVNPRVCEWL